MANLSNQRVLKIGSKNKPADVPQFITEDVVEVQRAKLIYYKWISRLMQLLATLSLLLSVCTTLSIMKLAPEIMVDPQIFVHMSDSQSVVKREYVDRRMESREKMMVNFIKQYIEVRNTFIRDEKEMVNRWEWGGLVSYLSTYKVYKKFAEEYPRISEDLTKREASRSVEILSVERTGGENSNTWKVEFKTYDYTYNDVKLERKATVEPLIIEKFWTANVRGYIDVNRRTSFRRLINPLGFVIYSYFQSEIEV
ncbi:MAG: type IV secretion system protein [Alphaproteobacteria bacterium]|nr:type IV secretion system protein [Alphaproteobacteria bacterium]